MAIWNRKSNKQKQLLQEASSNRQLDISALLNQPYYYFTSQLTSLRSTLGITSAVKQSMLQDPIVTQIINMWISDSLSTDVLTHEVFDVEIKDNHSDSKDIEEIIKKAKEAIDYLRENSNLDEQLVPILYRIITEGIASVRLGFVDKYEDTKIKLFESNKRRLLSHEDKVKDMKLLEAPTYDDYENKEDEPQDVYSFKSKKKLQRLLGRFYFELLPQRIVPLKHKGITILYLDLSNSMKVLNPRNITTFVNNRGGTKTLSLKDNPEDIDSVLYEVPLGKSFIDQAVTPWSMYNTAQDCTILALMTRSSIYRIFQIDVGAMSTKETEQFLQEFKKRLTSRESIDVRAQHYSSAQTQLPLGDSILIPTRNGLGRMEVQAIGGDLNIQTEGPMEFFREEFLASLGIAKELVYGSENGSLINTSATRSDIRYLRKVQQFTQIMALGLEDIFKDYLKMLDFDLSEITLKVVFKQLNSEEALQKMEYEQTRQEALDRVITSLNNLGISFEDGRYINTRNELITRYMDADLLDIIKQDEQLAPPTPPAQSTTDNPEHEDLPPMSDFTDTTPDLPSDDTGELPPEDVSTEDQTLPEVEPVDADTTNPNPPYSLG